MGLTRLTVDEKPDLHAEILGRSIWLRASIFRHTRLVLTPNARGHQPGRATRAPVWWTAELGRVAANCILHGMTRALDAAIAKLAELPAEEQDRIARWLLDELGDEELWARQFAASQEVLSKLAAEAQGDRAAGRAAELDPDKL